MAHGSGRIAVRADEVQGRPPVAVDMTLADSDTESSEFATVSGSVEQSKVCRLQVASGS